MAALARTCPKNSNEKETETAAETEREIERETELELETTLHCSNLHFKLLMTKVIIA